MIKPQLIRESHVLEPLGLVYVDHGSASIPTWHRTSFDVAIVVAHIAMLMLKVYILCSPNLCFELSLKNEIFYTVRFQVKISYTV